jgi:hypothetical protein
MPTAAFEPEGVGTTLTGSFVVTLKVFGDALGVGFGDALGVAI